MAALPRPASERQEIAKLIAIATDENHAGEVMIQDFSREVRSEKAFEAAVKGDTAAPRAERRQARLKSARAFATRFEAFTNRMDSFSIRFNSLARSLGAKTCAENP